MLSIVVLSAIILGNADCRRLDLTHGFDNNTWYWPSGQYTFSLKILDRGLTSGGYWYESNQFQAGEHGGTHMDSPNHFAENGKSVDEVPIDKLFCPAVMIDIREKASQNPDVNVTVDDVNQWESQYGEIPENAVVFMCSGWSAMYGNDQAGYWGNDEEDVTNFHFPGFSASATIWLAENRKISGIAVDTPSVDYGPTSSFPSHVAAMTRDVYGLENVKDPCSLPPSGATVYVMPMKTVDGSGAPVRIIATWDDDTSGTFSLFSIIQTTTILAIVIIISLI